MSSLKSATWINFVSLEKDSSDKPKFAMLEFNLNKTRTFSYGQKLNQEIVYVDRPVNFEYLHSKFDGSGLVNIHTYSEPFLQPLSLITNEKRLDLPHKSALFPVSLYNNATIETMCYQTFLSRLVIHNPEFPIPANFVALLLKLQLAYLVDSEIAFPNDITNNLKRVAANDNLRYYYRLPLEVFSSTSYQYSHNDNYFSMTIPIPYGAVISSGIISMLLKRIYKHPSKVMSSVSKILDILCSGAVLSPKHPKDHESLWAVIRESYLKFLTRMNTPPHEAYHSLGRLLFSDEFNSIVGSIKYDRYSATNPTQTVVIKKATDVF